MLNNYIIKSDYKIGEQWVVFIAVLKIVLKKISNPFKDGESHFNGIIAKQLEQKK